jgi:hypothetical protein
MTQEAKCFIWNMRGLNGRARRHVVREFVLQERPLLVCLQETNLNDVCDVLANEILGPAFAYAFLPIGTAGGVLLGWHRERVMVSDFSRGRHSISAKIK